MPEVTPDSIARAWMLLQFGKFDRKGRFSFDNPTDPAMALRALRSLRNFAETRAASTKVVRIRSYRDDEKVEAAACELMAWSDAVLAAYSPLCGDPAHIPKVEASA